MSKHILSVSYDSGLLQTRELMFLSEGYEITSTTSLKEGVLWCGKNGFDLFIVGHSIPDKDKTKLIRAFKEHCPAPILALLRTGELRTTGADYYTSPNDPVELINSVNKILS